MLDAFIVAQRREIITRTTKRAADRPGPKPDLPEGIPAFLDQLVTALRLADSTDKIDHDQIRQSAGKQGGALLRVGVTIDEVVHHYGDVCQTITELAIEEDVRVPTGEFRVMNLCLDDAIAEAVKEFTSQHERAVDEPGQAPVLRVHELRKLVTTATTAFEIIKRGQVAPGGATGKVLDGSLAALSALIEQALADVPSAPS